MPDIAEFILLLVSAYLLGSVPAAYLAARWARDIDIRRYGSGNIGASNLWRSTSKWLTLPVIAFDFAKGMPMVWLAHQLGLGVGLQVAVGLAAVVGHNWPLFLGFNGGRGMLTTLGVAFILPVVYGLFPWEATIALSIAAIGGLGFRNAPVAVALAVVSASISGWALGRPGLMVLGFLGLFLLMLVRRLIAPRTVMTPLSWRVFIVNRLLFDRDIRDKNAWLRRRPPGADGGTGEENKS